VLRQEVMVVVIVGAVVARAPGCEKMVVMLEGGYGSWHDGGATV
jgi:hypothetical protein